MYINSLYLHCRPSLDKIHYCVSQSQPARRFHRSRNILDLCSSSSCAARVLVCSGGRHVGGGGRGVPVRHGLSWCRYFVSRDMSGSIRRYLLSRDLLEGYIKTEHYRPHEPSQETKQHLLRKAITQTFHVKFGVSRYRNIGRTVMDQQQFSRTVDKPVLPPNYKTETAFGATCTPYYETHLKEGKRSVSQQRNTKASQHIYTRCASLRKPLLKS